MLIWEGLVHIIGSLTTGTDEAGHHFNADWAAYASKLNTKTPPGVTARFNRKLRGSQC